MKICFVTFACPTMTLDQVIDTAVRLGYQGIEFRCDARHAHGVEIYTDKIERKAIRQKLDRHELEVPCLGTSLRLMEQSVVEQAAARLELAAQVEAKGIRVFCGPAPEGMEPAQVLETAAERLRDIAKTAQEFGVQVWLETHDTFMRGEQCARVIKLADRPELGVVYDIMHPFRDGETLAETMVQLQGLIRHVHFHDALNDRKKVVVTPMGKGQLPVDEILDALIKSGYNEYLSGEWFHDMYGSEPEEALGLYMQEISEMLSKREIRPGTRR